MAGQREAVAIRDFGSMRASLEEEHARLDEEVQHLSERRYLSVHEQMERKRLQKLKLAAKDRLQMLEGMTVR